MANNLVELIIKLITQGGQETSDELGGIGDKAKETQDKLNGLADELEKNSGNAFKQLNQAIKQAKADVLEFGANTVSAKDDTKTYGQVLQDLTEKKKVLARQTRVTGEQFSGFATSIGVAGMNIRNIITDIRALNAEKQSTSEFALSIGQIGISAIAAAPAIQQLNIQWKALGGTGMFLGGSVLPTLLGGIALVTAAYGTMYGAIKDIPNSFERISQVLSGQLGLWDAVKQQIDANTFGLLGLTDASNNFDSSNVQQQLSDIAYIANFSANALASLKKQVQSALEINAQKYLQFMMSQNRGSELMGPELPPSGRPGYYDDKGTWHAGIKPVSTGSTGTGSSGKDKEQRDEIKKSAEEIAKENIAAINDAMVGKVVVIPNVKIGVDTEAIKKRVKEEGIDLQVLQQKEEEKITAEKERQLKLLELQKKEYEEMRNTLDGLSGVISIISGKLGEGGRKFSDYIQTGFNLFKQFIELQQKESSPEGAGFGDFLGIFKTILGFAFLEKGGPAAGGNPYIVGEKGPELFIPDSSGVVMPNSLLGMIVQEVKERTNWSSRFRAAGGAVQGMSPVIQVELVGNPKIKADAIDLVLRRFNKNEIKG